MTQGDLTPLYVIGGVVVGLIIIKALVEMWSARSEHRTTTAAAFSAAVAQADADERQRRADRALQTQLRYDDGAGLEFWHNLKSTGLRLRFASEDGVVGEGTIVNVSSQGLVVDGEWEYPAEFDDEGNERRPAVVREEWRVLKIVGLRYWPA